MRLTRFSRWLFKQQIPLASLRKRAQPAAARLNERRINPPGRKKHDSAKTVEEDA